MNLFSMVMAFLAIAIPQPAKATVSPQFVWRTATTTVVEVATTTPLFERIANCESGNIATSTNPLSTAKGRFQFLDGTWEHYGKMLWKDDWSKKDPFNYEDNTELAWFVYSHFGTDDWLASEKCWKISGWSPVKDV